jgi:hypothetical protein
MTSTSSDLSEHDKQSLLDGKIGLLVSIGIVTFAASCLPWVIQRKFKNAISVSL